MFGLGTFGELSFAEPLCVASRIRGGAGGGLIGGSGFPPNWEAEMAAQRAADERRRREREEQEVIGLVVLGVL